MAGARQEGRDATQAFVPTPLSSLPPPPRSHLARPTASSGMSRPAPLNVVAANTSSAPSSPVALVAPLTPLSEAADADVRERESGPQRSSRSIGRVSRTDPTMSPTTSIEGSAVAEKRKRSRVTAAQLEQLEAFFKDDRSPTAARRKWISDYLGMNERQTQIWFQNRRAKAKMLDGRARAQGFVDLRPPTTPPALTAGFDAELHNLVHEDDPIVVIPCTSLAIGSWRRVASVTSRHDLVAYMCEARRCLTWYVHAVGAGFKMEVPFDSIVETAFANTAPGAGVATFHLSRPPVFFLEEPITRQWRRCGDWTEGCQASHVLTHELGGAAVHLAHLLRELRGVSSGARAPAHAYTASVTSIDTMSSASSSSLAPSSASIRSLAPSLVSTLSTVESAYPPSVKSPGDVYMAASTSCAYSCLGDSYASPSRSSITESTYTSSLSSALDPVPPKTNPYPTSLTPMPRKAYWSSSSSVGSPEKPYTPSLPPSTVQQPQPPLPSSTATYPSTPLQSTERTFSPAIASAYSDPNNAHDGSPSNTYYGSTGMVGSFPMSTTPGPQANAQGPYDTGSDFRMRTPVQQAPSLPLLHQGQQSQVCELQAPDQSQTALGQSGQQPIPPLPFPSVPPTYQTLDAHGRLRLPIALTAEYQSVGAPNGPQSLSHSGAGADVSTIQPTLPSNTYPGSYPRPSW